MPLSHDPPEFLLHKAGQRAERRPETEKDRNRTSHLKNGQNIYSGNNGEWTGKGPPPMPPLWPLEIAVENGGKRYIKRRRPNGQSFFGKNCSPPSPNTGKRARTRGAYHLFHRLKRSADFSAAPVAQCGSTIQFVSK